MINTNVFGVIWWSFPPWLTDGALLEELVHLLHLGSISASAASSKRPAWMACGKEGRPGHGFSFFFWTQEDRGQRRPTMKCWKWTLSGYQLRRSFFSNWADLIKYLIKYWEMMEEVCVCGTGFFFVEGFGWVFFIDYERKLKVGDCLNLWCFVCRCTRVLQVAISDQMEKLCEPLPK